MSGNLKTLLVVLALGALISVSYLFSGFKPTSVLQSGNASILNGAISSDTCQRDTDKDGLSDCQEAYWKTDAKNPDSDGDGFLDGEEVLSGHSPVKAGPDDFLGARGNVTQQAATLLLGGLTSGDLSSSSANYGASVQKFSAAVLAKYQANSQVLEETITTGGNMRADIISYGFTASNIVGADLQQLTSGFVDVVQTIADVNLNDIPELKQADPEAYGKFISAIEFQIATLESQIARFKKIAVPPSMAVSAKNMLMLLRGAQQQYRLLHQISEDSVQGLLALQSLANLTGSTTAEVAQDFAVQLNTALSTSSQ